MKCQLARILPITKEQGFGFHVPDEFHGLLVWVEATRPTTEVRRTVDLEGFPSEEIGLTRLCLKKKRGGKGWLNSIALELLPHLSEREPRDLKEWIAMGGEKLPEEELW